MDISTEYRERIKSFSADCVGASSVNILKNKIDIYLRRVGLDRYVGLSISQMAS